VSVAARASDPRTATYAIHGLRVRSEVPLTELETPEAGKPDVEIRWGDPDPRLDDLNGEVVLTRDPDAGGYLAIKGSGGYTVRFPGYADFDISPDGGSVFVYPAAGADPSLASLLLSGTVLSLVLELRGACIMHASCIAAADGAIAFVGPSGAGKSTVATLFCAEGALLVSDDALRVEVRESGAVCFPGTGQLRLRPSASALVESLHELAVETTPDERVGIKPVHAGNRELPLRAVVLPIPSRDIDRLAVRRLRGRDALMALVSNPRTVGWIDAQPVLRHFDVLTRLVETVPVLEATIPWGPPFDRGIVLELEAAVAAWR
jgi:hypothetical protein